MSDSNPPNGLSDAERTRLTEELDAIYAERALLAREADQIIAELAADEAFRRRQPGTVHEFRPRPGGDSDE